VPRVFPWADVWPFVALAVIGLLLRVYHLGDRALHHDESLHAVYSWYLYVGRGYVHDPLMHGPYQFHVPALIYFLFGASDFTARFAAVLHGTGIIVLPYFLRHELGLTGTHLGCEHGVCGACTVIIDGVPARSCLMLAVQADGATVRTVEGLARPDGKLHPIQQAFWDKHGLQCGFCTPGMLMTLAAVIEENPAIDESGIREAISGNICRCTGYETIVDAGLQAAAAMRGEG